MQWDLSMIEPGLQLRVGPTLQADSVLEFAMDPVQNHDRYLMEEPSTGIKRILPIHSSRIIGTSADKYNLQEQ